MATAITPGQIIELEQSGEFQKLAKQYIKDHAVYLAGQDGREGNRAGLTPNIWARQEMMAFRVMKDPNRQPYSDWAAQMLQFLKGQPVWENNVTDTITLLVDSGKMQQITVQTYELRSAAEDFPQDPSVYAGPTNLARAMPKE
jgi:hypothetical protein